jgi:peptidoglycan hydrolase CwlO-like protein
LRAEGEALAKQNGKQAEVIRKLRAKEKTTEGEIKKLRADTDRLTGNKLKRHCHK